MTDPRREPESTRPLVEIASDESVLRALAQSAHPVEFLAATPNDGPRGLTPEKKAGS